MATFIDNFKDFSRRISKIRGIVEGRLNEDLKNPNLDALSQSIRISLPLKTKNELIKFLQYKIKTPPYGNNYSTVYAALLGEDLFKKLRADKLIEQEKNTVCAKFIERLLKNRALVFHGADSMALLRNGQEPTDDHYFLSLPKDSNALAAYLSYAEFEFARRIALSSLSDLYKFTGVQYEKISTYPIFVYTQGVVRLDRPEFPEYSRVMISEKSRPDLYKELDIKKIQKMQLGDVIKIKNNTIECMAANINPPVLFNQTAFKNLVREGYENYFANANRKAAEDNKQAYVRLLAVDDSAATVYGCDATPVIHDLLDDLHHQVIKDIIDHPDFDKDHTHISKIELSHPRWKAKKMIKNKNVLYKDGTQEDESVHFAAAIDGVIERGSTAEQLLCINMPSSANAYMGNRIYNNKLSHLDAEIANCTNVTTLFNPDINPLFQQPDIYTRILIYLPNAAMKTLDDMMKLDPNEINVASAAAAPHTNKAAQRSQQIAASFSKTLCTLASNLGAELLKLIQFLSVKVRERLQKK